MDYCLKKKPVIELTEKNVVDMRYKRSHRGVVI